MDIRELVESKDPARATVRPGAVTFLVYVPSLQHTHRTKILGDGPKIVLDRLSGDRTTGAVAAELDDEYGLEPAELFGLVRNWLDERILAVDRSR